jgi:WD40 repeat protein/serine/threonine protein kinase
MTEETIFQEALSRSPEERAAFLDQACAGRADLRAAIEALFAAHAKPDNVLDKPPVDLGQTVDSDPGPAKHAGTGEYTPEPEGSPPQLLPTSDYRPQFEPNLVIAGRYTLLQKIGEGGMGEVWVAKQSEPVKRKVALKLIKTGMDSKAVLTRFEQERQALAMMDHPNIARVLDGGMTPTGQPFFVMELVNGLPLNKFCDEMKLTPKERLELFVPICHAVQHAHQKGIVHRDLKPANILITMIDGKPVPKVIDFGVAKATAGKLTDESMSTQFGAVVGTLEYMSPEQAGFAGEDIDTRADIYSLGVILYESLTGLKPIDAKRLRKAALAEMIRIIREEEPSKPSTRLSTDESLPSLAALRKTEPKKLMALLRGELDWVVMKCLEKQRERRYETANGLARDIQRYLADEVVEARPPSASYRLKKFVKRNKGQVVAASLVLFALLAGITGTTIGMFEARKQEFLVNDALKLNKRQLAENYLQLGQNFAEKTEHAEALLAFAQGLAILPAEYVYVERVIRLNMGASYARAHRLQGLYPHGSQIHMVIFSPDGSSLITAGQDSKARIWDRATGNVKELNHGGPVWNVAITHDGNTVATASEDGTAALWNRLTGERLFRLLHPPKTIVNQVRFSHDGKWLVTGANDNYIRIWDVATGKESQKIPGDGQVPHHRNSFAFSTDGKILATTHGSKGSLWRIGSQDPPAVLEKPLDFKFDVDGIAFSLDDDRRLLAWDDHAGKSPAARVWDLRTGEPVGAIIHATNRIHSARISPDGKLVLLGCENGEIHLHEAAGKEKLPKISWKDPVIRLAFHPTKPFIFSAEQSGTLVTYEIASGRQIGSAPSQAVGIESLAFSPDRAHLAIAGDKTLGLWKVSVVTGERFATEDHSGSIDCLAFHPLGNSFLTSDGNQLRFWHTATGKPQRPDITHPARMADAFYSQDGDAVLIQDLDSSKTGLWRFIGDGVKNEYDLAPPPNRVALSPDGKLIAGTDGRNNIYLWDFATGKPRGQWQDTEGVDCLIFVNNDVISTSTPDGAIKLWEAPSGKSRGPAMQSPGKISSLAVSRNLLLAGHRGGTAQLWDWTAGAKVGAPLPHGGLLDSVAFNRDGNVLITGGHQICLWDRITQKRLGPPLPHDGTHLAVSPTEDSFLSSGFRSSRSARLWSLPKEIAIPREHAVLWSQVVTGLETGLEVDDLTAVRVLDAATWQQRRQRLQELGGPPQP